MSYKDRFDAQAVGAGSAAESVMGTGGTIIVQAGSVLTLTDFTSVYIGGPGTIRIRETGLGGAIRYMVRHSADGTIVNGVSSQITLAAPPPAPGAAPVNLTFVVTQEGNFPCGLNLTGYTIAFDTD